jgi:hypothetical protein
MEDPRHVTDGPWPQCVGKATSSRVLTQIYKARTMHAWYVKNTGSATKFAEFTSNIYD